MVMMSELVMAYQLLAGLNEDALHGAPPVVLVGGAHAMHLPLAADGVAILLPCHTQEDVRAHMFESHSLITLPVDTLTLHCPQVQVITLAILSKGANLLETTQTDRRKERFIQICPAARLAVMSVNPQ